MGAIFLSANPFSTSLANEISSSPKASTENFAVEADAINYHDGGKKMVAKGNVNIIANDGSVWADKITYNASINTMVAEGNVIFVDSTNNAIFVDRIELDQSMNSGILHQLRIRLNKEGPALAAERAESLDGQNISLVNAVYKPMQTMHGRRATW